MSDPKKKKPWSKPEFKFLPVPVVAATLGGPYDIEDQDGAFYRAS
ncbi:MAG: hypothetical protein AB7S38_35670 [Vulcanimicrobiota bacterium]